MDFHFYFPTSVSFEPWDHRNPDSVGIGGSETSQIEMSWRLAAWGHRVTCYAPIPDDCPREWRGTIWKHDREATFTEPGVWCLYRCPEVLDKFHGRADQQLWLICQDEDYPHAWNYQRCQKLTRLVALCEAQAEQFRRLYPWMADKVCVSSNGIKTELIRGVEARGIERDPYRLFYCSSPDRALVPLLSIFQRVREFEPRATLHVAYGFDNIDKVVARMMGAAAGGSLDHGSARFLASVENLKAALTQPGIVWHGRLPQFQLIEEWFRSGLWVYPCSRFRETSCITSMEAQACGAWPVVSPVWAVGENVLYGETIAGDTFSDPLTQCRFVAAVLRAMDDAANLDREKMSLHARCRFGWNRFAAQWEDWAEKPVPRKYTNQFEFQHAHAVGRILNVGCDADTSHFKRDRGAVNVDIWRHNPYTGMDCPVDVIADARCLPNEFLCSFDTVILGDILEHFVNLRDVVSVLKQARFSLKPGGRIIITCPEDHRLVSEQVQGKAPTYADGVLAYHAYPVTRPLIEQWLACADLELVAHEPIAYPFTPHGGHGIVAVPLRRPAQQLVDGKVVPA